MKMVACVVALMALGACCLLGGEIDGPELDLRVAARWNNEIPPSASSATVTFYVMDQNVGQWVIIDGGSDVPYPMTADAMVDTFVYEWFVPLTGEHVTTRYEVDLTVAGVTYTALEYPELACESGVWWWLFGGRVFCEERER